MIGLALIEVRMQLVRKANFVSQINQKMTQIT